MRPRRSPAVTDTSPEAEEVLGQLLRKAPAWRKLEMVADLNRTLRGLVMSDLSERYSGKSENELRVLLAERLYGTEVAQAIEKALLGRRA